MDQFKGLRNSRSPMTPPRATGRGAKYSVEYMNRDWCNYMSYTEKRRAVRAGRWQAENYPSWPQWRVVCGKKVIARWKDGQRLSGAKR